MLIPGLLTGLATAWSHSFSYLGSRSFLVRPGRGVLQLLILGHVLMGAVSLVLLPFLWRAPQKDWGAVVGPLCGTAGFYLFGQAMFFVTIRTAAASRVSALLGLKIVFVAALQTAFGLGDLTAAQWAGVGLAAAVPFLQSDPRVTWGALLGVGLTCAGYAGSDTCIPLLIAAFDPGGGPAAALFATALTYASLGVVALPGLLLKDGRDPAAWRDAVPFALFWYLAMVFLFITMGLVGVVLAVILQATRGLWSVLLGRWSVRRGWLETEWDSTPQELTRQLLVALLMCLAVGLYVWGRAVGQA
jgi:hypothetical protein